MTLCRSVANPSTSSLTGRCLLINRYDHGWFISDVVEDVFEMNGADVFGHRCSSRR